MIYKGFVKWNGQLFKGIHQPLITDSTYKMVQTIFNERDFRSPRNGIKGLLKDFLICGRCRNNIRPHYTKKKNGNIYRHYRCATTINNKVKSTLCAGQYIPVEKANEQVLETILNYANESELKIIQHRINNHNKVIEKEINIIKSENMKLEAKLKTIKQKKELYLDSLVTKDFSKQERQKINEKIDDFSLQEKQIEASIYRYQFELSENQEKILIIDSFKEAIIKLKVNHSSMSEQDLKGWLKANIKQIIYDEGRFDICFKALDI